MERKITDYGKPEFNFVIEKNIPLSDDVTSMAFSDNGMVAACSTKANINVFDAVSNEIASVVPCKNGATNLEFNHTYHRMFFNSMRSPNIIQLLDYATEKCYNVFIDVKSDVRSISMHPGANTILTSNQDKTIKLWDERSTTEIGCAKICAPGIATFHPDGIAVMAANDRGLFVYDTRNFSYGSLLAYIPARPFDTLRSIRISPNGELVALLDGDVVETLYTKEITPLNKYVGFSTDRNLPLDLCFNVDSSLFFLGTTNNKLSLWDSHKTECLCEISCDIENKTMQCLELNPEFMQLCSAAGNNVTFWQLSEDYVNIFWSSYRSVVSHSLSLPISDDAENDDNPGESVSEGASVSQGEFFDSTDANESLATPSVDLDSDADIGQSSGHTEYTEPKSTDRNIIEIPELSDFSEATELDSE